MPRTTVRPGHVIRDVLMRQQPILPDDVLVNEATPSDLYRTYISLVREANVLKVGQPKQRGMSRHSFTGLLYQAKRLGLLLAVREEEASGLPSAVRAPLLNIDGVPSPAPVEVSDRTVVEARRIYYQIGGGGASSSSLWDNIPKAYMNLIESTR